MKLSKGVAVVLSATASAAFCADPPVTSGPPVVVTATRFDDSTGRSPIGVQVITEQDIRRSTANTVPDLLRQLAGIRVRDSSGNRDVQVDMRGFGIFGDQNTLVLLDGVRISENEQTTVNWSGIPLSAIERIEIMRGSGAVLYGGGATGGTINIITKSPTAGERSGFVYGAVETYDTKEVRAGANVAGRSLGLRFNASHYDTDNYRDNNNLRQTNGQADLRWTGDRAKLSLKAGADDQSLRLPGALSSGQIAANRRQAATPRDYSNRTSEYINLGGDVQLGGGELAANLGYRDKQIDAFIVGSTINGDMSVWSFSPRFRLPYSLGGNASTVIAGFDWDDWNFQTTNANAFFFPPGPRRPDAFQRNIGFYLQNTTEIAKAWTLTLGGRLHEVEYGVVDLQNPVQADSRKRDLSAYEIAARYRASEALSAYGKLGYSFRVPNVNDVYNLFTGVVGILEPQRSHDREIGLDFASGPHRYRVALYHMDLTNELVFDPVAFVNRNLQPTRRYGAEIEGRWQVGEALDLFANYTYAVSRFREGTFGGIPLAGKDVPLVPRHAANIGAGWAFAPRTRVDVVARYVGEQRFDADETNVFGMMPAYTVVDMKLAHERNGWQFAAGVRNLFNEKYFSYGVFSPAFPPFFPADFFAYPAPERSLFVSAQYNFR